MRRVTLLIPDSSPLISLAMKDRGESGETGPTVVQQIVEEMGRDI